MPAAQSSSTTRCTLWPLNIFWVILLFKTTELMVIKESVLNRHFAKVLLPPEIETASVIPSVLANWGYYINKWIEKKFVRASHTKTNRQRLTNFFLSKCNVSNLTHQCDSMWSRLSSYADRFVIRQNPCCFRCIFLCLFIFSFFVSSSHLAGLWDD